MGVVHYELDKRVFEKLKEGNKTLEKDKKAIDSWQGAASGIADYVASWGLERFWAMSRSPVLKEGGIPEADQGKEEKRRYFAWGVARLVLCEVVGEDLDIQQDMTTQEFQNKLMDLNFNEQVLLADLLIEISATIQFWTMRLKDVGDREV